MSINLLSNTLQYETQGRSIPGVTFFLSTNDTKLQVESQGWLDAQLPPGISHKVAKIQAGDFIDICFMYLSDQIRYVVTYIDAASSFKLVETGFGSGPSGGPAPGEHYVTYESVPVAFDEGYLTYTPPGDLKE